MLYRQLSQLPVIPVLVALALAVAVALPVSADSDEVAGTMVSGGAAQVQAAPAAVPAPALAPAARTQRYCDPSPSCPLISRTSSGWEIDTGGPGVYFERFAEDGD